MSAQSAHNELPDRGRWDGEVIASGEFVYRWGTYAFRGRYQTFADGAEWLEMWVPDDPPLCAREIVAAGLGGDTRSAHAAVLIASRWGIDVEEEEVRS